MAPSGKVAVKLKVWLPFSFMLKVAGAVMVGASAVGLTVTTIFWVESALLALPLSSWVVALATSVKLDSDSASGVTVKVVKVHELISTLVVPAVAVKVCGALPSVKVVPTGILEIL